MRRWPSALPDWTPRCPRGTPPSTTCRPIRTSPGRPRRALLGRLDDDDLRALHDCFDDGATAYWAAADEVTRKYLTLNFGVHYEVPSILAKTGLSPVMPPEDVHAMARGPVAAGGDAFTADLVLGALERAGSPLPEDARALDFGCSSGRVVRMLAAARPDVSWLGCDPNAPAIEWAREHLDCAEFFVSPQVPPLELQDGSLDLVYAISIWSHFDADAGLRWFAEMQRLLRPGGVLVFSTHGIASIGRQVAAGALIPEDAMRCSETLYSRGFWFAQAFGEEGDHGVISPDWGMAYATPEWLLTRLLPAWSALLHEPARLDGNQDLYVLERRAL